MATWLTAFAAAVAVGVPMMVGLMAYIRMLVAVRTQDAVQPIVRELAEFATRLAVMETTLQQVRAATASHPLIDQLQVVVGSLGALERKVNQLLPPADS